MGTVSTWTDSYGKPNYNVLGSTLGGPEGWTGTKPNPNSAILYLNPANPNYAQMAQPALREFRGHDYVKETDPTGTQPEHWFYQGDLTDAECGYPKDTAGNPLTGSALYSDASCFLKLRDRELLKGREYRTRVLTPANAGNTALQEVQRAFAVQFYSYSEQVNGETPNAGLWRAFPYENATTTILFPTMTGEPAQSQTTKYFYNPDCTPNVVENYGNLGCTQEYGAAAPGALGALERTTKRYYATRDDYHDLRPAVPCLPNQHRAADRQRGDADRAGRV